MKVSEKYLELLSRESRTIIHFNDVFFEHEVDFDAELTVMFRNLATFSSLRFPIGKNPKNADYGVVLLDDLLDEEHRIIEKIRDSGTTCAIKVLEDREKKQVLCIINTAPRNSETTGNGRNGEDFHLAITVNGLEIYAVPLARLQGLETRNRILALYRIENETLISTDGYREQFRSSIISTSRYFPETLVPIFQYDSVEELIAAKRNGTHPDLIKVQEKSSELAFIDKFGNVRISVTDCKEFMKPISSVEFGDKISLQIGDSEKLQVHYVTSLKDIPDGQIGLYQNVADKTYEYSEAGYFEIVKKSADPNNEKRPASFVLNELNSDFSNEVFIISPAD